MRPIGGRRRIALGLGILLYTLVLVLSPMLHHDLDCHLRSPSHCGACVANPLAPRAETAASLPESSLPEAGWVDTTRSASPRPAFGLQPSGRSPPA